MTEFKLPPAQDLERLIRQEHHQKELLRLRMGMAGCGCAECQEFYSTIDLAKYGSRVCYKDSVLVETGKAGADLMDDSHDYWAPEGFFVHYGKKYSISKNLATVCLVAVTEKPPDGVVSPSNEKKAVSKITAKDNKQVTDDTQTQDNGIMKQRGRPRKEGEVSRVTAWRRAKETQGALL